jgi:hypothetical protein
VLRQFLRMHRQRDKAPMVLDHHRVGAWIGADDNDAWTTTLRRRARGASLRSAASDLDERALELEIRRQA